MYLVSWKVTEWKAAIRLRKDNSGLSLLDLLQTLIWVCFENTRLVFWHRVFWHWHFLTLAFSGIGIF